MIHMTEPFDVVLAEMRTLVYPDATVVRFARFADRLSAAHAAEVAERDARIAELEYRLQTADAYGLQCDGDIRALLDRAETAERDAGELRGLLRECLHILDGFKPARANEHDELAARVAAIATTEQADED